jgi:hypothetical protein
MWKEAEMVARTWRHNSWMDTWMGATTVATMVDIRNSSFKAPQ